MLLEFQIIVYRRQLLSIVKMEINKNQSLLRIALLLFLMISLILLVKFTFIGDYFEFEKIQQLVLESGKWGFLIFLLLFLLGTLMNVPGAVFLVFSMITYGYLTGIILSFICLQVFAMINFYFARYIGGKGLSGIQNERILKVLDKVDEQPIKTICWLRVFMLLSPVVNYTMALTKIRPSVFFIANLIGMLAPFSLIVLLTIFIRNTFF